MQFTVSTIALVATLMASHAAGMPFELTQRSQMCGTTPSASGSQTPLSAPSVTTAESCRAKGAAEASCKSFVFGLPPNVQAPICRLFAVSAAQIPPQEDNLEVFDIACTDVPTSAPTTDHPVGLTASEQQQQSPAQGQTDQTGQTGQSGSQQGQTGQTQQKQQKRNVCGATPTGPASNSPKPVQTSQAILDVQACRALGKSTIGVKSVEFGKPGPASPVECLLFQVSASELPPPTNGQTFIAYDIGC